MGWAEFKEKLKGDAAAASDSVVFLKENGFATASLLLLLVVVG